MARITLQQLLTPYTPEQAVDDVLNLLASFGFNTTSWQSGSEQHTQAFTSAFIASKVSGYVATLAGLAHNDYAFGEGLTRLSVSHFDNERQTSIAAQHNVDLEDVDENGPFSFTVGSLRVQDTTFGKTFTNTTAETLTLGGTLSLVVQAEEPGALGNAAQSTITKVLSNHPGVTVTNPDVVPLRLGVDSETDVKIRARNKTKWSTLGGNAPAAAYEFWALNATDVIGDPVGITRVFVDATNPLGPYTLIVYLATDNGPASLGQIADVKTYTDVRKSVTARTTYAAAVALVQDVTATVYMRAGTLVTLADLEDDVAKFLAKVPIGGTKLSGTIGYMLWDQLRDALKRGHADDEGIFNREEALNVQVFSPTGDVPMAGSHVIQPGALTITIVEVA